MSINVFVTYSKQERRICSVILGRLRRLVSEEINVWCDEHTPAGVQWDTFIRTKAAEAHIALILVSKNSLNSRYCKSEMRLFEKNFAYPISVILSPCGWKDDEWISKHQVLPSLDKTLSTHYRRKEQRNEFCTELASVLQMIAPCTSLIRDCKRQRSNLRHFQASIVKRRNNSHAYWRQLFFCIDDLYVAEIQFLGDVEDFALKQCRKALFSEQAVDACSKIINNYDKAAQEQKVLLRRSYGRLFDDEEKDDFLNFIKTHQQLHRNLTEDHEINEQSLGYLIDNVQNLTSDLSDAIDTCKDTLWLLGVSVPESSD